MSDPGPGGSRRRPVLPRRNRKRWLAAAAAAGCWLLILRMTGSLTGATVLLALGAAFAAATVLALRVLGVDSGHPWVQQLASRPWRDGQDVLRLSLRHLPEVFVVSPAGSLLAPTSVEILLSPRDFGSLTEVMDTELVNSSAAEVYAEQVAGCGAQLAGGGPVEVSVVSDPSVPAGRYRLHQGRVRQRQPGPGWQPQPAPGQAAPSGGLVPHEPGGFFAYAHDGQTHGAGAPPAPSSPAQFQAPSAPPGVPGPYRVPPAVQAPVAAVVAAAPTATGLPTIAERGHQVIPPLRLVSGDRVAQTSMSGARAGRGSVELVLPQVPTVSREHARFTFAGGQWWVTNLGRNGLTLNGVPLAGEQPVRHGDSIRWGSSPDALVSRVEIG